MSFLRSRFRFVSALVCTLFAGDLARAIDPATAEFSVAFTQAQKLQIDPKPVKVELYVVPEDVQDLAIVEVDRKSSRNYVSTNTTLVTFHDDNTGYQLSVDGLKVGARIYGDRKYSIQTLPAELSGLPMLTTRMAHKGISDVRYAIGLTCEKPCYVFVAIDERALETYKRIGAPSWLQEFAPTDWRIETDDPLMNESQKGYLVFGRKMPAGRIVLGAPAMDVNKNCMYFAFFAEAK